MKKILSVILALAMMMTLFVGCASDSGNGNGGSGTDQSGANAGDAVVDQNDASVTDKGNIDNSVTTDEVVMIDSSPSSLDITNNGQQGNTWTWSVYEMLYQLDGFGGARMPVLADASRGDFEPGMDHEDGSNMYTIYIHDNIYDSAGNHFTAADVGFSVELIVKSGNARGMKTYDHYEVVDDTTINLFFTKELNAVGDLDTYMTSIFMVTEKAYNDSETGLVGDACGTGPYVIKEWVPGSYMTLSKRDDYWCAEEDIQWQIQNANAETVKYIYISDTSAKVIALQSGEADLCSALDVSTTSDFQEGGKYSDDYSVYTCWNNLTTLLLPNCSPDSICGDVNMRKAIFYAVDIDGVIAALSGDAPGSYRACYGVGNPNFPDFSENWATWDNYQTKTDNDLVKQYLDAAGYNGEELKIITLSGDMETIATVVLNMLNNVGINASITLCDTALQSTLLPDTTAWDLSVESWASSDMTVNVWNKLWTFTGADGLVGNHHIDDTKLMEMCSEARTLTGHTQEAVDAVQQYIIENAYAMGISQSCSVTVYSNKVNTMYLTHKNSVIASACTFNAD